MQDRGSVRKWVESALYSHMYFLQKGGLYYGRAYS